MQKPKPQAELIITVLETSLTLTVHSNDAKESIERLAPQYGTLLPFSDGRTYILYILKGYDTAIVANYLRESCLP